jgi:hypothetical protein
MPTVVQPCCGLPGNVWRGDYCRCCGKRLGGDGRIVFCDRRPHGPCPYCRRADMCGPHGNDDTGSMPARRFCEIDGQECDASGRCPTHAHQEAPVR